MQVQKFESAGVTLELKVSPVFVVNYRALAKPLIRYIINQGGTRSGKTWSILQCIIIYCLHNTGKIIDIVRKTQAELVDSVITDFDEIIEDLGISGLIKHNKTRHQYRFNGNTIRFLGMDKAQKKKGSKRNLLYINEANGLTLEDFIQLDIRTTEKVIADFNPSEYFWVNEHILEKPNDPERQYKLIKSTYLDNYDFLDPVQIRSIENLINIDDFYYKVYVLGILAIMKGKIYERYEIINPEVYDMIDYDERYYGIDWGYEHCMVLIEVKYAQEQVYERELWCDMKRFDDDLIAWMEENNISMTDNIYADPAYPASIKKMREKGFNVIKAKKDIQPGIRFNQGLKRNICASSRNYIRQIGRYKWKQTANGEIVLEPVKIDDDLPDASRYANYTHLKGRIGE